MRTAILAGGLLFCFVFGMLTLTVAFRYGFDIFSLISLVILGLIATGLVGAIRHPDE